MKLKTTATCIFLCLLSGLSYGLENTAQKQRHPGGSHESRMLGNLLSMDDAQLAKLRETIERIEQMSPEEKQAMRKRLKQMNQMDPSQVDAMRDRFQKIPKEERETMRQRWTEMSPVERQEWREKLRNMTPEERKQVTKDEGFLPPPPGKKGGKGPKGGKGGRPAPQEGDEGTAPPDTDVFVN